MKTKKPEGETIPLISNWKQSARIIGVALESGSPKAKSVAMAELVRMAGVADFAGELADALRQLHECIEQGHGGAAQAVAMDNAARLILRVGK